MQEIVIAMRLQELETYKRLWRAEIFIGESNIMDRAHVFCP